MSLREWAASLLRVSAPPDAIDLHAKDTAAAFLAGIGTVDGTALSHLYGARGDACEMAAAVSAIARLSECDDIHLASCVTPGAVVIPVALALAAIGGEDEFRRAVSAGYTAGLSLGMAMGGARALASGVWPTLAAAPLMAAVTASCSMGHDPIRLAHAVALALAGASGRLGRPAGTPSGRWFLLGEAVLRGIRAAEASGRGFQGDLTLLSKPWMHALAGHDSVDMGALESSAAAPSISDVGFKPFPIARQGANAVAAFQSLLSAGLEPRRIETVQVFVPAMNVKLLDRPVAEDDRLSLLCNIGFQLACAALAPEMLYDTTRACRPLGPLIDFAKHVTVTQAADLESQLPNRWPARVVVKTNDGILQETVIRALFDHDADDLSHLLTAKWCRLPLSQEMPDIFGSGSHESPAVLWQGIAACVSMAAREKHEPKPTEG